MEVKRKMVNATELRKKNVLLELRLENNPGKICWLLTDENEYAKIEHMNTKECINHMRTYKDMLIDEEEDGAVTGDSIKDQIDDFIETIGKGNYSVSLENYNPLVCSVNRNGSIYEDQKVEFKESKKKNFIIDYLITREDNNGEKYHYQELTIVQPTFLGSREK